MQLDHVVPFDYLSVVDHIYSIEFIRNFLKMNFSYSGSFFFNIRRGISLEDRCFSKKSGNGGASGNMINRSMCVYPSVLFFFLVLVDLSLYISKDEFPFHREKQLTSSCMSYPWQHLSDSFLDKQNILLNEETRKKKENINKHTHTNGGEREMK